LGADLEKKVFGSKINFKKRKEKKKKEKKKEKKKNLL